VNETDELERFLLREAPAATPADQQWAIVLFKGECVVMIRLKSISTAQVAELFAEGESSRRNRSQDPNRQRDDVVHGEAA
jgi:hypothetical protein